MISANWLGILLTGLYALWAGWYFLASGAWNPLDGTLGWFGPANFTRNFAVLAPLYLTLEALLSALAMTTAASAKGRLVGLVNLASTIMMLLFVVVIRARASEWGVAPEKLSHLNFAIYLSVLDAVTSLGVAYLVSLAHRTFGVSNQ